MSVKAYKIEKIKEEPTFDLWYDELLVNILDAFGMLNTLNENDWGIIKITEKDIKYIEKLLEDPEFTKQYEKEEIDEIKELLNKIKKDLDPKYKCVFYFCF